MASEWKQPFRRWRSPEEIVERIRDSQRLDWLRDLLRDPVLVMYLVTLIVALTVMGFWLHHVYTTPRVVQITVPPMQLEIRGHPCAPAATSSEEGGK